MTLNINLMIYISKGNFQENAAINAVEISSSLCHYYMLLLVCRTRCIRDLG